MENLPPWSVSILPDCRNTVFNTAKVATQTSIKVADAIGTWVKVVQPIQLQKGYNDLVLVSQTVGLQNYGAHLERDGAGFRGEMKLTGFKNGDLNLLDILWTYQVGLKGVFLKIYAPEDTGKAEWVDLSIDAIPSTFTWYKTYFDVPAGDDPVALDLGSMGKGQLGSMEDTGLLLLQKRDAKAVVIVAEPTIPISVPRIVEILLKSGGNPFEISVKLRATRVICAQVSESHYPPPHKWLRQELYGNNLPAMELLKDSCHAPSSLSVVSKACQGRKECNIKVSNAVFGDPWRGIIKTLAVEAKCTRSSNNGSFQY
ncbi:hypothetical protein Tsubulata_046782 [Turnera subulata]|uniref:SUEL-type lectin domain-containing protein n=1 Tax=Turnera subulata TaxID=218843 RepID=A0A9Q0F2W8_9ROSI|nr:hypothetical protein Tsubulata_046782 [Turnera subulata]